MCPWILPSPAEILNPFFCLANFLTVCEKPETDARTNVDRIVMTFFRFISIVLEADGKTLLEQLQFKSRHLPDCARKWNQVYN
jgi:hypothetical protein